MPRTIMSAPIIARVGRPAPAGCPRASHSGHVLLQEPHGQRMAVRHHDHLAPALCRSPPPRPSGPDRPPPPARGPPGSGGARRARRRPVPRRRPPTGSTSSGVDQEQAPGRQHLEHRAHPWPILGHAASPCGSSPRPRGRPSPGDCATSCSDLARRHRHHARRPGPGSISGNRYGSIGSPSSTSMPARDASRAMAADRGRAGQHRRPRAGRRISRRTSNTSRRLPRSSTMIATRGAPGLAAPPRRADARTSMASGRPGGLPRPRARRDPEPNRLASPAAAPATDRAPTTAISSRIDDAGESLPHSRRHRSVDRLAGLGLRSGRSRAALVQDLHRLQQIERALELRVALQLLLRRCPTGRRAAAPAPAPGARRRGGFGLLHDDVRRDALAVDASGPSACSTSRWSAGGPSRRTAG